MNSWRLHLDQLLESLGPCFPTGNSLNTLRSRPLQLPYCSDYCHILMQSKASFMVYFCQYSLRPHLIQQNSHRARRVLAMLILLWSWSSHSMQAGQPPICDLPSPPDKGMSFLCLRSHHVISLSLVVTHLHWCGWNHPFAHLRSDSMERAHFWILPSICRRGPFRYVFNLNL